jgi:hypothetical protein
MELIVPYLGRNNWKGKEILLFRDILKTNHLHRAVVCYGYKDDNDRYQYLTQAEALQNNMDIAQVEHEARANMLYLDQTEDAPWIPVETESQGQTVTVLTKTGGDLTASNILREDILKDLQHYFESPTIAIAVPNRNTILVCSKATLMLDLFKRKYQESVTNGFEPVSDMVYLAKGGVLIGAAPFPGTEDYVDRTIEDVHTVSLKKNSGGSTRFALKRPEASSQSSNKLKAPQPKRHKTKFNLGKKKVTFKLK